MSNKAKQQEEKIKKAIVDGYRRGVCNHNGGEIPKEKQGMAGKGSHFGWKPSQKYRDNYERIFGKKA